MELTQKRTLCRKCAADFKKYGDYTSIRQERARPGAKCQACSGNDGVMDYISVTTRIREPIRFARRLRDA